MLLLFFGFSRFSVVRFGCVAAVVSRGLSLEKRARLVDSLVQLLATTKFSTTSSSRAARFSASPWFTSRWSESLATLLLVNHYGNSTRSLADLKCHLRRLRITPSTYTFARFQQPNVMYWKQRLVFRATWPWSNPLPDVYIGSTGVTHANQEHNRRAKLHSIQQGQFVNAEPALRWWPHFKGRCRENGEPVADVPLYEDVVVEIALTVDLSPQDFVTGHTNVAQDWTVHCLEAGLHDGHDILEVDEARCRCAVVRLLARKDSAVVTGARCFKRIY